MKRGDTGRATRSAITIGIVVLLSAILARPAAAVDTPIAISTTAIDFGNVAIGATVEVPVQLTNTSGSPFGPINMFGGAPPTAEFNASQNCQAQTLAAGASCQVTYSFSPGSSGSFSDSSNFTVSETSNQADGEDFSVSLTGQGYGDEPLIDFSQQHRTATCPPDQRILGGGLFSQAEFDKSAVVGTRPFDGLDVDSQPDDGWEGIVDTGDVGSGLPFYAAGVCQGGRVASRLKYRQQTVVVGAGSRRTKSVQCPKGYKVTGGGVTGEGVYDSREVEGTRPLRRGRGWKGRVNNFSANPQTMTVDAICATGRFARKLVYRTKPHVTVPGQGVNLGHRCPGDSKLTGGGLLAPPSPTVVGALTEQGPPAKFVGRVDETGSTATTVKTYVICKT
jgi:Abnormal spindle-like microcephaly-assoc'd, ASPM-SPD-2-Hydin